MGDNRRDVNGTSQATEDSFILGTHSWDIEGDEVGCGNEANYTTLLKLTGCKEGEFTCRDGQCVTME